MPDSTRVTAPARHHVELTGGGVSRFDPLQTGRGSWGGRMADSPPSPSLIGAAQCNRSNPGSACSVSRARERHRGYGKASTARYVGNNHAIATYVEYAYMCFICLCVRQSAWRLAMCAQTLPLQPPTKRLLGRALLLHPRLRESISLLVGSQRSFRGTNLLVGSLRYMTRAGDPKVGESKK